MNKKRVFSVVAVGATAVGLAMAAVGNPNIMPAMIATTAGPTYDTVPVTRGSIRKIVSTSGPVRALVTVQVGSQLSGQIVELKVDFNSEVKPDEVMAVLDDKSYVAKVAQAKADLAQAEAQLLNQLALLDKADAVMRQAGRAIQRQSLLAQRGVTAQATVDNAQRDADVAKAEIAVQRALIDSAKATVAQRKAQLDQAQIDLDRTRVRSPIHGTVISRTIDIGQTVAASLQAPELFKIAQDLRRIRIEAQVNEADVGSVREGNDAEFTVDAYPERKFKGTVTQVRLAATEINNVVTYTVIIEAQNDDRQLFPGMTANVQIASATKDGVLRVANDALRYKPRAAAGVPTAGGPPNEAQREQRLKQMLAQLKTDVGFDSGQLAKAETQLRKAFADVRPKGSGGPPGGGPPGFAPGSVAPDPAQQEQMRQRIVAKTNEVIAGIVTEAQRPAFDAWATARMSDRPAASDRSVTLWVLAATGDPEARQVRLGLADDQATELLGDTLKEGDRVVTRAREAKR